MRSIDMGRVAPVDLGRMAYHITTLVGGENKSAEFRPDTRRLFGGRKRPIVEVIRTSDDTDNNISHVSVALFAPQPPFFSNKREQTVRGVTITLKDGAVTGAFSTTGTKEIARDGKITEDPSRRTY